MKWGETQMIVNYPSWLRYCIAATAVTHDVFVILAGVFAFDESPRTIMNALPDGPRAVWALMLVLGGTVSLIGVAWGSIRIETTGCVLVIGAKVVWVVAALTPGSDLIGTQVLAAILMAGATGTLWRVWGLYVGQYLRARE